jgi:predicted methyltransferase
LRSAVVTMDDPPVLSHFQTDVLLAAREASRSSVLVSPDLGLTEVEVVIDAAGARFPAGHTLGWDAVQEIHKTTNSCFLVQGGRAGRIQLFSELTNRLYTLMPTGGAPTLLISGILMHRIKGTDPYRDTREKIRALGSISGQVLDTATGLGYTAIEAARYADAVLTVELDPAVLEIARLNPWSRPLFENERILQSIGDSFDVVEKLGDGSFSRVIHDPPTLSLAGHLYSGAFYGEMHRVLSRGGRLFHYVGDPDSRSGRSTTRGVIQRLQEAGFSRVERRPRAFGVMAQK